MKHRLLIANRGEIACRIIESARLLGIPTIAVYASDDAQSRHVTLADVAVQLDGESIAETYLNVDQLLSIAQTHGATLVHPGYGFLSENPHFARRVSEAGLGWVGPPADVIESLGSKIGAKRLADAAKVPTAPWFMFEHAAEVTEKALNKQADKIGYPLLVKASGGGGGKGMRLVTDPSKLHDAYETCVREASNSFKDSAVFLERYMERARHVEVQILADQHGHVIHLLDRECSSQRRHQKVIEEAPAPALPDKTRHAMHEAAVRLAKQVGYVNAGTVEFIVDDNGHFYFLEVNTRLQVEHPVTEWICGVDIVAHQLRIAMGEKLAFKQSDIVARGHAIEARVYAEDPSRGFCPTPGPIKVLKWPLTPNLRIDTGLVEGGNVSPKYDPMVAKLSVWGENRDVARSALHRALSETTILGFVHNIEFLKSILVSPFFNAGEMRTHTLETAFTHSQIVMKPTALSALVAALMKPASVSVSGDLVNQSQRVSLFDQIRMP